MDPATTPPPNTLSSSANPVENLSSPVSSTAESGTGFCRIPGWAADIAAAEVPAPAAEAPTAEEKTEPSE